MTKLMKRIMANDIFEAISDNKESFEINQPINQ